MHIEATAKARYLRTSGRKARIVADLVRGKTVDEAIALQLHSQEGGGAH